MTNVKPEYYKSAYNKLYRFLESHHPEILNEYREGIKKAREKAEAIFLMGKTKEDSS